MISRRILTAALAAGLTLASGSTAFAADRWVKIVNTTSVTIYRFYASDTNNNNWGPDLLKDRTVPPGYSSTINLNGRPGGCTFDLLAQFEDGDELEDYKIDVCGGFTMTYYE